MIYIRRAGNSFPGSTVLQPVGKFLFVFTFASFSIFFNSLKIHAIPLLGCAIFRAKYPSRRFETFSNTSTSRENWTCSPLCSRERVAFVVCRSNRFAKFSNGPRYGTSERLLMLSADRSWFRSWLIAVESRCQAKTRSEFSRNVKRGYYRGRESGISGSGRDSRSARRAAAPCPPCISSRFTI